MANLGESPPKRASRKPWLSKQVSGFTVIIWLCSYKMLDGFFFWGGGRDIIITCTRSVHLFITRVSGNTRDVV